MADTVWQDIDPLEQALLEASSLPTSAKKRRRVRGKKAADDSSADDDTDGEASEDSSATSADMTVNAPEEKEPGVKQPAGKGKVSSYFHTSLGVQSAEGKHAGMAKCRVCAEKIPKSECRLIYVHSLRKPHAYIHARCAHKMSDSEAQQALDALIDIVSSEASEMDPAIIASIAGAMDVLRKRLPENPVVAFCFVYIMLDTTRVFVDGYHWGIRRASWLPPSFVARLNKAKLAMVAYIPVFILYEYVYMSSACKCVHMRMRLEYAFSTILNTCLQRANAYVYAFGM